MPMSTTYLLDSDTHPPPPFPCMPPPLALIACSFGIPIVEEKVGVLTHPAPTHNFFLDACSIVGEIVDLPLRGEPVTEKLRGAWKGVREEKTTKSSQVACELSVADG